jgi:hypothetical protein
MDTHMSKSRLCFLKCQEYGINLHLEKCAFMAFLGMILGFIVFKERKLPNPKKIHALMNIQFPPTHITYRCSMTRHNFINVSLKILHS